MPFDRLEFLFFKSNSNNLFSDENKIEDPSFYVYACKLCARPQIFFKTKDLLRRHYHVSLGSVLVW